MFILGISGPTCSGKTTLAKSLASHLSAPIIALDNHTVPESQLPLAVGEVSGLPWVNWDSPSSIDFEAVLSALLGSTAARCASSEESSGGTSLSSFSSSSTMNSLVASESEIHEIHEISRSSRPSSTDVLIVEGFLVTESQPLLAALDGLIVLSVDKTTSLSRRIARAADYDVHSTYIPPPHTLSTHTGHAELARQGDPWAFLKGYYDDVAWPEAQAHSARASSVFKEATLPALALPGTLDKSVLFTEAISWLGTLNVKSSSL